MNSEQSKKQIKNTNQFKDRIASFDHVFKRRSYEKWEKIMMARFLPCNRSVIFGPTKVIYFQDDAESQECRRSNAWQSNQLDQLRFQNRIKSFEEIFNQRSIDKFMKVVTVNCVLGKK